MAQCENHTAFLYDRGGERQIGVIGPLSRIKWGRTRDDVSVGTAYVKTPSADCNRALGLLESGRGEMVIFRNGKRVWEGPIVRVGSQGASLEIEAHDVMHYPYRTIMRGEYDNRYPNNGPVLTRVKRIMDAELARKEALDPPVNVLAHAQYLYSVAPATNAGTAARTLPYELTVYQHIDAYAANGGIDYTVVGRAILFFDVHHKIGQTPLVTVDDFIGDPIITQYGMELATYVAMTDGKGHWGEAGGVDPFYGEWEILHQAYDENAGPADQNQIPTVAELTSQAVRAWNQSKVPPLVVRVPDNTRVNPSGTLGNIDMLVPGTHVPLTATTIGRKISQMQKLDSMSVEEIAGKGETIKVTLSPAVFETFVEG